LLAVDKLVDDGYNGGSKYGLKQVEGSEFPSDYCKFRIVNYASSS